MSLPKSTIDDTIQSLRRGNDDLEKLSRQIESLKGIDIPATTTDPRSPAYLSVVQKASKDLHGLLSNRWSCTAEHSANICLNIEPPKDSILPSRKGQVQSDVAWTCIGEDACKPLWLTIESLPDDPNLNVQLGTESSSKPAEDLLTELHDLEITHPGRLRPKPVHAAVDPSSPRVTSDVDLKSIQNL